MPAYNIVTKMTTMARSMRPEELMRTPLADLPVIDGTHIPKIIHQVACTRTGIHISRLTTLHCQSWKSTALPPQFEEMANSWKTTYPDFIYVLWLDDDNLKLVRERAPEHLEMYKAFPREIYRADFARNVYMQEL